MGNVKFTPEFMSKMMSGSNVAYIKYDSIRIILNNKPRVEFILNNEVLSYLDLPAINKGDTVTLNGLDGYTSMKVS
jgi:hypothetical protein